MGGKTANKAGYFDKLKGLLDEYKSIFIVTVDNVSSQQMHEIRSSLRGDGVVLMGKNTMVPRNSSVPPNRSTCSAREVQAVYSTFTHHSPFTLGS